MATRGIGFPERALLRWAKFNDQKGLQMRAKTIANPAGFLVLIATLLCLALALPATAHATQARYGNFSQTFTVTGNPAKDMIAVAKAQEGRYQPSLGYTEGWCADFVSDCAKTLGQGKAIPFSGMVSGVYSGAINAGGKVVSTPQPGDLVFFNFDHVGIMIDKVNCISGNMGNPSKVSVCRCEWVIPGAKIKYVRPAYTKNLYQVAFNANGGTGTMTAQKLYRDSSNGLKANAFKRTGYTFVGWNTKKDGTGKNYRNKVRVKNLGATGKTVTLYAKWKPQPYKVAFNANGGTGTMSAQTMARDTSTALKANTFKRKGYTFASWNTKKNGTGKNYGNKVRVKNLGAPGKTVTLYAKWKKA